MLCLSEITNKNIADVFNLSVYDEQMIFVFYCDENWASSFAKLTGFNI